MSQGDIITLVFTGVVAFLGGIGMIVSFIKKWFVEPQVEQTRVQSMTNKQLASLADQMKHQNELNEVKLTQMNKDIDNVNGRVNTLEDVVFVKAYIK